MKRTLFDHATLSSVSLTTFQLGTFAKERLPTMNRNAMHELLLRHAPGISAADHKNILDGMRAEGLFDLDDNGHVVRAASDSNKGERKLLSPMQAMRRTELHPMIKHAAAQLRRAGYDFPFDSDQPLSLVEIDKAFKAANLDHETRIWIKSQLGAANLL